MEGTEDLLIAAQLTLTGNKIVKIADCHFVYMQLAEFCMQQDFLTV